jgi:hypothetical protein
MIKLFWEAWGRRLLELPVEDQVEVLLCPTGLLALGLAELASEEAYALAPPSEP